MQPTKKDYELAKPIKKIMPLERNKMGITHIAINYIDTTTIIKARKELNKMAGTKAGGIKARNKIKELYGEDYYARTGRLGGLACVPKGFAASHERAVEAGKKGGKASKRGRKNG